jgi:hypothetical protein
MQDTTLTDKDKTCLHCGTVFRAERSTKKYCSDACKQTAFYQRSIVNTTTVLSNNNEQENTSVLSSQNNEQPLASKGKDDLGFSDNQTQIATVLAPSITLNDNKTNVNYKPLINKDNQPLPQVTSSYIPIPSTFIMAIAEQVDDMTCEAILMNNYPDQYWQGYVLTSVNWANTRLRCLVENLLWLGKHTEIKRKVFMQLTEAFTMLVNCNRFKQLPQNYPNRTIAIALSNQCNSIVEKYKKKKVFQLQITKQRKIQCIALRFMLAGTVPKVKFSGLDFGK